jgi:fatty acid desaturase
MAVMVLWNFVRKTRIPRFTPLPLFYPFQLAETKVKENPEKGGRQRRRNIKTIAALLLAVIQACLTIEGMGIEGFVLWVIILFAGYWIFFTLLLWIVRKIRDRS